MSREAILNKIAEKLDEDSLLKLAADLLTEEDIISLSPPEPAWLVAAKEAAVANGASADILEKFSGVMDSMKSTYNSAANSAKKLYNTTSHGLGELGSAVGRAGSYALNQQDSAMNMGRIPGVEDLPHRLATGLSHVGDTISKYPGQAAGAAVGGAAAMGGLYLLAKKMGLVGQPEEPQSKMASFNASPELEKHLNKLAQDKEIIQAVTVLLQNGLL